jgi:hypothetical protein
MSAHYERGGIPRHVAGATGIATVVEWTWPNTIGQGGGPANYLWFQNTGTGPIVLSFTQVDADNNRGISIAAGADYLLPTEIDGFYTKAVANETFQAVVFLRRG